MTLCKIRDLQRAITEYEQSLVSRYSITLNEGMTLLLLRRHHSLHPTQIAAMLRISMSGTSKIIRSIEDKQLIARTVCPNDRRHMCFTLTPAGADLLTLLDAEPIPLPPPLQSL